jgi:alginate O-acetyltransferase complex protein AlgI
MSSAAIARKPANDAGLPWTGGAGVVAIFVSAALAVMPTARQNPMPPWLTATIIALGVFFALKLVSLRGCDLAARGRVLAYVFLWPGMNARSFLDCSRRETPRPSPGELALALLKLGVGLFAGWWAVTRASVATPCLVAGVGIFGLLFTFHFGAFHVTSWFWRRHGVAAPRLMRAPIAATSLAEFWGERWNTAFAELARRFVLRPLARRAGVNAAGAAVLLLSGLVHELAISVPARGGWGRPTLYFVLQGAGVGLEKSRVGRRLGLGRGWRGWSWAVLFTAVPLPLLFHAPLLERVVEPLFRFLKEVL